MYFDIEAYVAWIALVLQCPVYFMLHLYIEAIIPDNYGIAKSCCFCCKRKPPQSNMVDVEAD